MWLKLLWIVTPKLFYAVKHPMERRRILNFVVNWLKSWLYGEKSTLVRDKRLEFFFFFALYLFFSLQFKCAIFGAIICFAVLWEADFPDTSIVHRYVLGEGSVCLGEVLAGFKRYPSWMWANNSIQNFISWLRDYNLSVGDETERVGVFGLDLYSLHKSMENVISYLLKHDPIIAAQVREDYVRTQYNDSLCFDPVLSLRFRVLAIWL